MGIPLISDIVPQNGGGFPTHSARYGKGGWRAVADATERDAIDPLRREVGMRVYLIDAGTEYRLGSGLTNGDWVQVTSGGGGSSSILTARIGEPSPSGNVYATLKSALDAAIATGEPVDVVVDTGLTLDGQVAWDDGTYAMRGLVDIIVLSRQDISTPLIIMGTGVVVSGWGALLGRAACIRFGATVPVTTIASGAQEVLISEWGWGNGDVALIDVATGGAIVATLQGASVGVFGFGFPLIQVAAGATAVIDGNGSVVLHDGTFGGAGDVTLRRNSNGVELQTQTLLTNPVVVTPTPSPVVFGEIACTIDYTELGTAPSDQSFTKAFPSAFPAGAIYFGSVMELPTKFDDGLGQSNVFALDGDLLSPFDFRPSTKDVSLTTSLSFPMPGPQFYGDAVMGIDISGVTPTLTLQFGPLAYTGPTIAGRVKVRIFYFVPS